MKIRDALINQGSSLALQRAAADEIDAEIISLHSLLSEILVVTKDINVISLIHEYYEL